MADYVSELANKNYIPNIIIKMKGEYFSMRKPDSGLSISTPNQRLILNLNINPTAIDPFRATTTVDSYGFKLLDKNEVITTMLNGDPKFFQGELVEIWVGRVGTQMDFSEYYKLPNTYINKMSKVDNGYAFQSIESRDRLNKGVYQNKTALAVNIFPSTTIITVKDVSLMPTSGYVKIESEYISYSGVDLTNNYLTGCVRGELGSTPAAHSINDTVSSVAVVEGNPIDMLLQLIISKGGGGVYDVLPGGGAIDQSLVDIDQFLAIKSEFFSTKVFRLVLSDVASLKTVIENELLFPLGLRLRSNNNSKIGLAVLDRNIFVIDAPVVNNDELTKFAEWSVDDTKITNRLRLKWDYNDVTGQFNEVSEFTDAASIAMFGESKFQEFSYKGIKKSLGGAEIINDIQLLFLARFSVPRPNISVNTHMSSSYLNLGDKTELITNTIPSPTGDLNFSATLEVLNKNVNHETGDVKFQLGYTSFSGVRQCYIAPSDTILSFTSQSEVELAAGRGALYRKGWVMRLYSNVTRDYASTQKNKILDIVGDVITFEDAWSTTLVNNDFRIMFADYDDVVEQQRKFCFISAGEDSFIDARKFYQITFG